MGVRKVNKKQFSCGHRSYGIYCHRCEQAKVILKLASKKQFLVTAKKAKKPRVWTIKEMLAEGKRLQEEGKYFNIQNEYE